MTFVRRLYKKMCPWARQEDGVVAVEFALLAIPYFLFIFGIMEVSFLFLNGALLESAIMNAARKVVTGEMHSSGEGEKELALKFRANLCSEMVLTRECEKKIVIDAYDVSKDFDGFSGFAKNPPAPPTDPDNPPFDIGQGGSMIVMRATYTYTMFTPFVGHLVAGADMQLNFTSTVALQNEPF